MNSETKKQLTVAALSGLHTDGINEANNYDIVTRMEEVHLNWQQEGRIALTGLNKIRFLLGRPLKAPFLPFGTNDRTFHELEIDGTIAARDEPGQQGPTHRFYRLAEPFSE